MLREAAPGVFHEGYGGWSFKLFATHHAPGQEAIYKIAKSPFVRLVAGEPALDVTGYVERQGILGKLDVVVFQLGLNETFALDRDDPTAVAAGVGEMVTHADRLVAAFADAAPEAKLGIVLPAPFTRSARTFEQVYGGSREDFGDPWRHRRIQHAVLTALLDRFGAEAPPIFVIPLNAALDTVDGYWIGDAGHPNEHGADQIAGAVFASIVGALTPGSASR